MANKLEFSFDGFETIKKQLDELGGGATERAVELALKSVQQVVADRAQQAMIPHNKTGRTSAAIIRNEPVKWTGTTAEIPVGFDIDKGGLASIYLMHGTRLHGQPHVKPDRNLYNAIFGAKTKKEVLAAEEKALMDVLRKVTK